jgi:hypothetical protein
MNNEPHQPESKSGKKVYVAPGIEVEIELETRAGSPLGSPNLLDPINDLFGE